MQEGDTKLMVAVKKGIPVAVRVVLLHKASIEARAQVVWCPKDRKGVSTLL